MHVRTCIAAVVLSVACTIPGASVSDLGAPVAAAATEPTADLAVGHGWPALPAMPVRLVRHDAAPTTATPTVVGPCPAYGTVLVPGSAWLSGRGVDVVSNGGTGATCYSTSAGHRWQCGELINRFLAARGWAPAIAGDAGQFYDNASPAFFEKHPIGTGYLPVPGDIVVWRGGPADPVTGAGYGHVAIVVTDGGGVMRIVEQNSTITGYGSISIDPAGGIGPTGPLAPVGYLHATANPEHAAAPAPPPAPKHPPVPAIHHTGPSPSPSPTPAAASASSQPTATSSPTPTPTPLPIVTPSTTSTPPPITP